MNFYVPKAKHIVITGHFGAGKTNIAVNLALAMRAEGKEVTIADMDIVNPYFRTADDRVELENAGVRCIIPEFANSNVDMPALPAEVYSMFAGGDGYSILDVGGDDSGAAALGMYSHYLDAQGYEMLYVISMYRPLTATPDEAVGLMREIEARSRLRCTGIVNNSSIGGESSVPAFEASFAYADETARLCGLPLLFDSTCLPYENPARNIFRIKDMTRRIWEG